MPLVEIVPNRKTILLFFVLSDFPSFPFSTSPQIMRSLLSPLSLSISLYISAWTLFGLSSRLTDRSISMLPITNTIESITRSKPTLTLFEPIA